MPKERIIELDVLRTIAFILVVMQHILGGYGQIATIGMGEAVFLNLCYVIAKPAVPIFLAITAMTLFISNYDHFNWKVFYKKRFLSIIIPYVLWTVYLDYKYNNWQDFLGQIAAGTGQYHLWYMGMILQIYLFFPLVLFIAKKIIGLPRWCKIGFFLLHFIGYWYLLRMNNILTDWAANFFFANPTANQIRLISITPLYWSLYLVLGAYILFNYQRFKEKLAKLKLPLLAVYLPLLAFNFYVELQRHLPAAYAIPDEFMNYFGSLLYMLFASLSILVFYQLSLFIANHRKKLFQILKTASGYTFAGYLIHVEVLQRMANEVNLRIPLTNHALNGVIILILTVILSLGLVWLVSFIPFSQYVTGVKKAKKPGVTLEKTKSL